MSAALQWLALGLCLMGTIWRIKATIQGRNPELFGAFGLATISVALSIPAIYLPIDNAFGADNYANLLLRICLFGVFFLLSGKIAAAFNSERSYRLIRGPLGIIVFAVSVVGVCVCFFLGNFDISSTGLRAYAHEEILLAYSAWGKLYLAYVSACLIPATLSAWLLSPNRLLKAAGALLSLGFALVFLTPLLELTLRSHSALATFTSFAAVVLVAAGLMTVWLSFLRRITKSNDPTKYTFS